MFRIKGTVLFTGCVAIQVLILAAIPLEKIYVRSVGKTVVLKTVPFDPYQVMSGYFLALSYEISRPKELLEGKSFNQNQRVYVIIQETSDGFWKAESIQSGIPESLPEDRVAIRGEYRFGTIFYGIEAYYVPEGMRFKLSDELQKHREEGKVFVKVDRKGRSAIERLEIAGRNYDY